MLTHGVSASLPGEFEPQSALVLGCNELLPAFPQVLVDLVQALVNGIPIIGIVDSEDQRRSVLALLCDWGLPAHLLHFVSLPVRGMWVRDYGPSFVRRSDGSIIILDAEYVETKRPNDDKAPTELAALLGLPVCPVPLTLEGGNLLSNGQGLCLTTEITFYRNATRGLSREQIAEMLRRYYGFDQIVVLDPLLSEVTGHVDMFATFVAADHVLVGAYDAKVDPVNADRLDANAARLAGLQTKAGPLRVTRIPMPSNRGSVWRTHTNVIYANGSVLMPTYGSVDLQAEEEARRIYKTLLPGWDVKGIDCSRLILHRGALRCVSINIPWLDDLFDRPDRGTDRVSLLTATEYSWP